MFTRLRALAVSVGAWNLGEKPLLAHIRANIRTDVIERMLSNGYTPNISNSLGITPLMYAAGNGNADTVSLLLPYGADSSACDTWGHTALHYAAGAKNSHFPLFAKRKYLNERGGGHDVPGDEHYESCLSYLCEAKGTNINAANETGEMPLMLAVGYPSHIELLLRYDPDLSRRNNEGRTALDIAEMHQMKKSAEMLRAHVAKKRGV